MPKFALLFLFYFFYKFQINISTWRQTLTHRAQAKVVVVFHYDTIIKQSDYSYSTFLKQHIFIRKLL